MTGEPQSTEGDQVTVAFPSPGVTRISAGSRGSSASVHEHSAVTSVLSLSLNCAVYVVPGGHPMSSVQSMTPEEPVGVEISFHSPDVSVPFARITT